ncbi:hypothetical protein QVD17_02805 [Tagetes erecta]|uniref:Transcription repressor n=1 Tax=Tagetes erecta TaxID=13708 RepID=A0AAD8LGC7_TARER|nr:hypothetical protein QVD17_02805 [Tagetes erecta]
MGNYRFRLSDMVPNAWFYKLKDMNKSKTTTTTTTHHHKKQPSSSYYSPSTTTPPPENRHFYQSRNTFYYTPKVSQLNNSPKFPHFVDPSTKSSKRSKPNRKTIFKPSKLTESTHVLQDFLHSPMTTTQSPYSESTQSQLSSSISHITIVKETKKIKFLPELDLQLPPIITKPAKPTSKNRQESISGKKVNQIPARKSVSGVKLRSNSPKLAVVKKIVQKSAQKKNLSESFAIVKSSFDPEQDFMQSMKEMITENNIRSSKDLEELLACYLSLNSDEYHDVIVKAFEQIWFSLPDL